MGKDVKRLFGQFQPHNYRISLVPDRVAKTYSGNVIISGKKTGRPSKRITLHQKGLKITRANILKHDKKGDQNIEITRINLHKKFDEVRLHSNIMLYPGEYTLNLSFQGKITRNMNGIYPCSFELGGKKLELLATQFESHHAREVFPCIDEPEAKATFDLTLTTPKNEAVIANTPVREQKINKDNLISSFETTPRMSTYLLAFVFGDLSYLESKTKSGIQVRAYATPEKVQYTKFALDTAIRVLDFYIEYFDLAYPLDKCDMVALPDFASGAMENWGLITYREQAMLVDPKNTSLEAKQYVAMVVAHELAHQWFGNLVTMRWWTDLWLNEGFASWIEYLAVDQIFPEWQIWTQFIANEQQRAFKLDALEHTHSIEVPVRHPDEIRTIFDTISYSKGASVIHMLYEYLTPDVFRDGLRHYLSIHKWGNTDTIDLWTAMEDISGKPVKDFMHAWTSQPGFPLLKVNINADKVSLSQERFYLNSEQNVQADTIWPIALQSGEVGIPDLLTNREAIIKVDDAPSLKFNLNQSGFYRVIYNAEHLNKLGKLIKNSQLSPLDRLGILSDMFEAAKAGKISTTIVLKFLNNFAKEDNSAVWDIISPGILSIRNVMDDENLRERMKPFIQKLTASQLSRLGWEKHVGESHFDQLLRPAILGLASGADEESAVNECIKRFDQMNRPEDIQPDLRGLIYSTVARIRNDKTTFDKLFNMHEASDNSEERNNIVSAITNFRDPNLYNRALGLINSDSVRLQDVAYWVAYSFSNRFAKRETWNWMKAHWSWLAENLGSDLSFYRFPVFAASAFTDQKFIKEYKEFFIPKIEPAFERSIKQGIEIITWQSAWKARDFESVSSFFKDK